MMKQNLRDYFLLPLVQVVSWNVACVSLRKSIDQHGHGEVVASCMMRCYPLLLAKHSQIAGRQTAHAEREMKSLRPPWQQPLSQSTVKLHAIASRASRLTMLLAMFPLVGSLNASVGSPPVAPRHVGQQRTTTLPNVRFSTNIRHLANIRIILPLVAAATIDESRVTWRSSTPLDLRNRAFGPGGTCTKPILARYNLEEARQPASHRCVTIPPKPLPSNALESA